MDEPVFRQIELKLDKLPSAISGGLLKTIREMKQLGKAEQNAFGNYKYVSIDRYLQVIPEIAAKNGIAWSAPKEVDCKFYPETSKGPFIVFTYSWDIYHEDGDIVLNWGCLSVVHPVQGPQTSGSSLAYAEKMFQRFLLKIPTGEVDEADAVDAKELDIDTSKYVQPEADKAAPETKGNGEIQSVSPSTGVPDVDVNSPEHVSAVNSTRLKALRMAIDMSKNKDHLMEVWTKNKNEIEAMHREDRASYDILKKEFSAKRMKVTQQ